MNIHPFSFFFFIIILFITVLGCATSNQSHLKNEYKLERVVYNIDDGQIRDALEARKKETCFSLGQQLDKETFEKERQRIEKVVKENIDTNFKKELISFNVDTTLAANKFFVEVNVVRNR